MAIIPGRTASTVTIFDSILVEPSDECNFGVCLQHESIYCAIVRRIPRGDGLDTVDKFICPVTFVENLVLYHCKLTNESKLTLGQTLPKKIHVEITMGNFKLSFYFLLNDYLFIILDIVDSYLNQQFKAKKQALREHFSLPPFRINSKCHGKIEDLKEGLDEDAVSFDWRLDLEYKELAFDITFCIPTASIDKTFCLPMHLQFFLFDIGQDGSSKELIAQLSHRVS